MRTLIIPLLLAISFALPLSGCDEPAPAPPPTVTPDTTPASPAAQAPPAPTTPPTALDPTPLPSTQAPPPPQPDAIDNILNRNLGGWEIFLFILLFGLVALLSLTFLRGFNAFVERVRKGRGAWRTLVLASAPIVRIAVLLGLVLIFGFIIFEGSGAILVIVLAIVAISVGLALVELVRNLLAGALIGLQKPFAIGDHVRIGDLSGEVQRIGLRSTLLIGTDGRRIDVPNSNFQSDVVINTSLEDIGTPVDLRIALATHTHINAAKRIALRAAHISQYASPRRRPQVLIEQESEHELALVITAYTFAPEFAGKLSSEIIELVFEGLKTQQNNTTQPNLFDI